jgi:hypothetical protein
VLSAATSLRGASRVLELRSTWGERAEAAPSWYTGRLWLVRVGDYKLRRLKEQATAWVWIVEQTVQRGTEKCCVLLGLRLSALPPPGACLRHEHVEPSALSPVKQSTGEVVYQQLTQAILQTGVPRESLSDAGPEVKAGIERFRQAHPQTCPLYDLTPQTAVALKHELEREPVWALFTQQGTQTTHRGHQTALAFLAPPTQRRKTRDMKVDLLIRWGCRLLGSMEHQREAAQPAVPLEQLAEQYGWITDFRASLQRRGELLQIVTAVEHCVRPHGLYGDCYPALEPLLAPLVQTERGRQVSHHLLAFVRPESSKAAPQERLLGRSEVREAVFGKQKRIEPSQAKSGFTGLLLTLSAMVAETTQEVIQKALETVSTPQGRQWGQQHLGSSIHAQRQAAFRTLPQEEQKQVLFPRAA